MWSLIFDGNQIQPSFRCRTLSHHLLPSSSQDPKYQSFNSNSNTFQPVRWTQFNHYKSNSISKQTKLMMIYMENLIFCFKLVWYNDKFVKIMIFGFFVFSVGQMPLGELRDKREGRPTRLRLAGWKKDGTRPNSWAFSLGQYLSRKMMELHQTDFYLTHIWLKSWNQWSTWKWNLSQPFGGGFMRQGSKEFLQSWTIEHYSHVWEAPIPACAKM